MNVRPLHDRIIVQRIEEGEQKVGGIIIPDTAKEKPQQGKVIAAGAGKVKDDGKRVALDVKAGDLILFGKYSGQEIKLEGDEYLIMREDEVLAHDQVFVALQLDLLPGVLAEQNQVAGLDVERIALAVFVDLPGAHSDDLALLRLFLGCIRNDDSAARLLAFVKAADDDPVV